MKYIIQKLENKKWATQENFHAETDEEAEQYVNENYEEDDGRMLLAKVIVEWF